MELLLKLAGIGQISLALGSLFIPVVLKWQAHLNHINTLIKQLFWTYAGYIFAMNLFWGVLSISATAELINGSRLALLMSGFIAVYWISRITIQLFYFDRRNFPKGARYKAAEVMLMSLFLFFSAIYSIVFYQNL